MLSNAQEEKDFITVMTTAIKMTVNFLFCHQQRGMLRNKALQYFTERISLSDDPPTNLHLLLLTTQRVFLSYAQILRNILLSKDSSLINYFIEGFLHMHALKFSFLSLSHKYFIFFFGFVMWDVSFYVERQTWVKYVNFKLIVNIKLDSRLLL